MSRYRQDHSFRERVKKSNRRTARNHYGLREQSYGHELRQRAGEIEKWGTKRSIVLPDKNIAEDVCFTLDEMARLLGRCTKTLRLWVETNRFPAPVCVTFQKWRKFHRAVYSSKQARSLLERLADHFDEKHYLSLDDIGIRRQLIEIVYGPASTITLPC